MTDETWKQIIDEESQARGIAEQLIQRVTRRSIERVLTSMPEQGALTDEQWARLRTEFGTGGSTIHRWLCRADIDRVLSRRPAPAPEPDSALGAMVDEAHIPPEPDDQFGDNDQSRGIAAVKGACARAGGFPKDAVAAGYDTGRNADSWIWGWQYCNDCLCDPDYRYAPEPAPQRADAAVVKRMLCAFYPATEHIFSLAQYERMTDALAVARRGMVPRTEGRWPQDRVWIRQDNKHTDSWFVLLDGLRASVQSMTERDAKRYAAGLRQELEETK